MTALLEIYTLGGLRFLLDGEGVEGLSTRKVEALALYLVANERPQPREALADLLWDDRSQSRAMSNLRVALTNLRKHLGPYFVITRDSVALNQGADVWLDTAELESELAGARIGNGPTNGDGVEHVEAALALYRGDFLQGFSIRGARLFEEWATVERERMHHLVMDGLSRVVDWYLSLGDYTAGIRQATRWLELEPLNEAAHQQMIRLLYYNGQPAAALQQYYGYVQLFDREIGLPPSPAMTELYEAIKAGSLAQPAVSAPVQSRREQPVERFKQPAFLEQDTPSPTRHTEFIVSRDEELTILESHLRSALGGKGRMVFISGEAGKGKTTLIHEFARKAQLSNSNLVVAAGSCPVFTPVSAPYGVFREVLEMLTGDVESAWTAGKISREEALRLWRILPDMVGILLERGQNLIGTLISAEGLAQRANSYPVGKEQMGKLIRVVARTAANENYLSDQGELFAEYVSVLRALSNQQPLVLFLDDLHWADTSSIGLLNFLGHRLDESKMLLVCTYRPEEVSQLRDGEPHPLLPILGEYKRRFGDDTLDLDKKVIGGGRSFVDALIDSEPNVLDETFRQDLVQYTGGHPLFTVELLRDFQERGFLKRNDRNQWEAEPDITWNVLPTRVEGVIETRISRLSVELCHWLEIASVEGERFTAEVIARAQDVDDRHIVRRLSHELDKQHRLVTAAGVRHNGSQRLSLYQFRHNLFRQFLYSGLDEIELSYLHEQVGEALEQLFRGRDEVIADRLAHHFQMAGNDGKAVRYLTQAAEEASRLYANDQAVSNLTQAIEAAERLPLETKAIIHLYLKRAPIFDTLGEFDRSQTDYENALQMVQSIGQNRLTWQAILGLGELWASRDYDRAGEYFEQALDTARQVDDPEMLALSQNRMGNWYANTQQLEQAILAHEQAFGIFQELQDKQNMASTLDLSSWAYYYRGDYKSSAAYFDRAIALFRELDDRKGLASTLANRGSMNAYYEYHLVTSVDSLKDSIPLLEESYRLAQEIGWRSQQSYALWTLGTRLYGLGKFGQALNALEKSLAIATEIGHQFWIAGEYFDIGTMYCGLNDPETAQRYLEQALTIAREFGSQHFVKLATGTLAKSYFLQGDIAKGRECLEKEAGLDSPVDTVSERYCAIRWAELALIQEDPETALEIVERLMASIPNLLPDHVISSLWRLRGEALASLGQFEEAESTLHAALVNASTFDEHFILWRIHATLGRLYQDTDRMEEANEEFAAVQQLTGELANTIPDLALKDRFIEGVSNYTHQ